MGLRGFCTPILKLACFFALSQNYQHLFLGEKLHLTVNCPRKSKIASKFRAKQFLGYWSKQHLDCFHPQPLGLLKFQCHLWVPWKIRCIRITFQEGVDYFEIYRAQNIHKFKVGHAVPLKKFIKKRHIKQNNFGYPAST